MKFKKLLLPVVMVLVAVFVCLFALPSEADAITIKITVVDNLSNGIYDDGVYSDGRYTISIQDGKTTILSCNIVTDGVYTIPDTLGGHPVTAIEEESFGGCNAKTIVIPDTITNIPDFAFTGCGATEIILPDTIKRSGEASFANCKSLTKITIPDSVTTLGWTGFEGCTNLKTVVLGKGMNYISGSAFSRCTSLRSVTIPAEITLIEDLAFYKCESLTDVFYYGTQSQWDEIVINQGNECLTQATVHFCGEDGVCSVCGARRVTINKQPVSTLTSIGEKTTITVEALGDGLTYRWYYKNRKADKFSYTTSFKGNRYWVEMSASRANRQIYCVITDKYGEQVTTETVTLGLKSNIIITKQPKSVSVVGGKTAKVSVTATGEGLTYQWYFKNAGAQKFSLTKAYTGKTYSVKMNASRAGRQVYCVITDKNGDFIESNVATLNASLLITKEPEDAIGKSGGAVYTFVKAEGKGLTYKWYFKNKGAKKFSYTDSFTGAYYNIKMNDTREGRQVYCVVTDKNGNSVTSRVATLYAEPTVTPASPAVKSGSKVKLTVEKQGEGFTYRWQVKTPSGNWKNTTTTGYKTRTLTVSATKARNGYQYRCVVSDPQGGSAISSVVKLKVK